MILCEHLSKAYDNTLVFHHFSLDIEPGITAILGPSGCGKTTLLRLIAGLEQPSEGYVATKNPVGMVFPDLRLIEWLSGVDNIRLVCSSPIPTIEQTLKTLEIDRAHVPVFRLSSGQKQRIALARAWLFESEWLLLDEAFRSWDIGLKQRLFPTLRRFWKRDKEVVLLITHDPMEAVMLADRVVVFPPPPVGQVEDIAVSLGENERETLKQNHPLLVSLRHTLSRYLEAMTFDNQCHT